MAYPWNIALDFYRDMLSLGSGQQVLLASGPTLLPLLLLTYHKKLRKKLNSPWWCTTDGAHPEQINSASVYPNPKSIGELAVDKEQTFGAVFIQYCFIYF